MRLTTLLISALLCLPSIAFAQNNPGDFGRLPDGRAYRVNDSGFQIVDRVAEQEVAIKDLNRQIRELEGRLDSQEGYASDAPFKEKSIIGASDNQDSFQIKDSSCLEENQKIAALEAELENTKKSQAEETSTLKAQVEDLEIALMDAHSEESLDQKVARTETSEAENDELNKKLASVSEELEKARDELKEKEQSQLALDERMTELSKQVELLKDSSPEVKIARSSYIGPISSEDRKLPKTKPAKVVDSKTLKIAKQEFSSNLTKIDTLIQQRKSYFDEARKSKTVGISPSALVTKGGTSLDRLRSLIMKANEGSNLSFIRLGLEDIETLLKEDITVAAKVAKL